MTARRFRRMAASALAALAVAMAVASASVQAGATGSGAAEISPPSGEHALISPLASHEGHPDAAVALERYSPGGGRGA